MTRLDTQWLERSATGEVLKPGEPGFDTARRLFNTRFDRRPALVVRCREAGDVQASIEFARARNLPLSVKAGGHSYAANSVIEGSLLIDLAPMTGIRVDPEAKVARVKPGVRWGDLDEATQRHGLAAVGGTVSTVGVAGFTLGGGNGYLSRLHGMACDNLLAAEVVTAEAEVVPAGPDENEDLLWALRGGSGNFGVVISFELALHEVGPEVLAGQIVHRLEDAPEALARYREFMLEAPEAIQCYAFVLRVPPIPEFPEELHGEVVLDLVLFHADPEGEEDLRPLLHFGDPALAFTARQSYLETQTAFDDALPPGQRWESRAHYLTGLDDDAIATFLERVEALPGEFSSAYFIPENGAVGRPDPTATAFPHRNAPFSVHVLGGWSDPSRDEEVSAWVREVHRAMAPWSTGGVYVNLLGTDEPSRVPAAYGENWERLAELKRTWDPAHLFQSNHTIDPGGRGQSPR